MRAVAQFAVLVAVYEKYHEKVVITAKWYRVCRKREECMEEIGKEKMSENGCFGQRGMAS